MATVSSPKPATPTNLVDDSNTQLTRAVVASTIGTAIEWYDFFLYGTATGLVFGKLYFPNSDPFVSILTGFAVYAVGFLARPVGAAIFGHYGDRMGRKAALIATLLLMGLATFAVGLVPTYAQIGIWGGVILTILRFIQGVGVGGEWGGSVLLSMEFAKTNKSRGLITSWPQFGVPAGLFLANLAVLGFSAISGEGFLTWGWRIPFLLSVILIGIGLWIRLGILETPTFRRLVSENLIEKQPVREVIKRQPKEIILSALARLSEQSPFYIFTTFVFTYGVASLGMPRNLLLNAILLAAFLAFLWIPLFGYISDRIGRRRMYLIGSATMGVFGFLYFALLNTREPVWVVAAIVMSLIPHAMQYGPQASLIAESFTPRMRYSGASIGYQLASVIAGGPAPLIAAALFAHYKSGTPIAVYIMLCSVVTIAAVSFMKDHTGKDISREYDAVLVGAE
jgi:metabolite-proton symporter